MSETQCLSMHMGAFSAANTPSTLCPFPSDQPSARAATIASAIWCSSRADPTACALNQPARHSCFEVLFGLFALPQVRRSARLLVPPTREEAAIQDEDLTRDEAARVSCEEECHAHQSSVLPKRPIGVRSQFTPAFALIQQLQVRCSVGCNLFHADESVQGGDDDLSRPTLERVCFPKIWQTFSVPVTFVFIATPRVSSLTVTVVSRLIFFPVPLMRTSTLLNSFKHAVSQPSRLGLSPTSVVTR
jgi:hypothetical protein